MKVNKDIVKGSVIDSETRCIHYNTMLDRVAIKFYCCGTYFPCYLCHKEHGCGEATVWPKEQFDEHAILCGNCYYELSINTYLTNDHQCSNCHAAFNSNCSLHKHLYFETR